MELGADVDLVCPSCEIPLVAARSSRGIVWTCPSCRGRAATIELLRRITARSWINELWAGAVERPASSEWQCPSCRRSMVRVDVRSLRADVCRQCQIVWLDARAYEEAPVIPERGARTLPQGALEAIARQQASAIAADYRRRFGQQMSIADALPLVPGLAGLPIEAEQRGLAHWPWLTWLLCVVISALGLWSLFEPQDARALALLANDIDRVGGATLITAMFVHSGVVQLATNVYFLLMFGDNVEDFLGPATFGLLFVTGGLAGNALHALFASHASGPLMGASGAVSAIVVFYACRFPNAQLKFIRLARWHTMPASAGLLFWLLTKLLSTQDVFGRAEPTAWPYLGGAATGLVMWLVLRNDPAR